MGSQLKQTVSETVLATTADLSTVVHTTGNESVSGVKTFANNLFVGDGSSNNVIIANNAIKQMVNGTTKAYNFPSIGGTLALTSDLAGYLPLSGGIVTDDVLETIQKPYMNNTITLIDEMDGTNNAVEITVTADVSQQDMVYIVSTSTYRPINCNVVVNSVTGNSADFPFDISVLTGDYQIVYDTAEACYKHVSGNQQFEIWVESNGHLDVYFSDVDEEHFYGTEGVVINESQKSINSRFITESEIDDRFKYNSDFTLWRKGSTVYAGKNADSLSGYTNGIFFGNNIKSSGSNNVIIGNGAYNMSGSSVVIGIGASATKSGNVSIGPYAYTYGSSTAVAIGSGARASYLGTAVGPVASAIGGDSSVAVGWKTKAGNGKDVAIGREAQTSGSDGNYSNIAIGAWSKAYATGSSPCISIGGNTVSGGASVGIYNSTPLYGAWSAAIVGSITGDHSVAIGGSVSANYAVQLGNGTNSTDSTLQFLSKKIADSNGYLYENNVNINTIYQPISAMSGYVDMTNAQDVSGIKKFKTIYNGPNSLATVTGSIDNNPGFTTTIDGDGCWTQFADVSGGYVYVHTDNCGTMYYSPNGDDMYALDLPKSNGVLTTNTQVNTAIGTINTNFTRIATMISTKPTDSMLTASVGSRATGWTFSSDGSTADNNVKIYHWGQMGVVMGSARKSSAITANTAESSLGTITMPSGYSILAAFLGTAGTGEIWTVNSSGVFSIRHFTAKSANTWIGFRIVVMLNNIGDRYSRTNVATI